MRAAVLMGVLGVALLACGSEDAQVGPDAGDDADAGGTLTSDEADAFDRGSEPMVLAQDLAVLADSFFDFDPTIDPAASAPENAARIEARILEQLAGVGGGGCGSVSLEGTTLTVDFGEGCTLLSTLTVSGRVSAGIEKSGATITVAFAFDGLVVKGKGLDGTASFATSTGTSFTVNAALTSGGLTVTATDLTVAGFPGGVLIDGVLQSKKLGATTTLTFRNVRWRLAECYPFDGALQVKLGLLVETFLFDADTPRTGAVTIRIGKRTIPGNLPAYGECPPE